MPAHKAMDPASDVILAYKHNGRLLTPDHVCPSLHDLEQCMFCCVSAFRPQVPYWSRFKAADHHGAACRATRCASSSRGTSVRSTPSASVGADSRRVGADSLCQGTHCKGIWQGNAVRRVHARRASGAAHCSAASAGRRARAAQAGAW